MKIQKVFDFVRLEIYS